MHGGHHSNMEGVWFWCYGLLGHRSHQSGHWCCSWCWLGDSATLCSGAPFLVWLIVSMFRTVKQPLKLLLQRLGALTPEVSLLLAVVTMVISPFSVISHSDGSRIDLSVESHFYIIPVLRSVIIIDVQWDVVLFGLNLHSRLHLCGVDSNVGTVIIILPVVTHLILMVVIRSSLMRICIVGSVGGLACGWGVCFGILCLSTPVVLSFILLTLMHGNE